MTPPTDWPRGAYVLSGQRLVIAIRYPNIRLQLAASWNNRCRIDRFQRASINLLEIFWKTSSPSSRRHSRTDMQIPLTVTPVPRLVSKPSADCSTSIYPLTTICLSEVALGMSRRRTIERTMLRRGTILDSIPGGNRRLTGGRRDRADESQNSLILSKRNSRFLCRMASRSRTYLRAREWLRLESGGTVSLVSNLGISDILICSLSTLQPHGTHVPDPCSSGTSSR